MYEQQKKQRIARIIEVAIPLSIWDMFEDLLREYKTPGRVIVESIKALHRELHGSLEDISLNKPIVIMPRSFTPSVIQPVITDGKIAKMAENGKKIDKLTQKKLEKIDELLEKVKSIIEKQKTETETKQKEELSTESMIRPQLSETSETQISDLIQQLKELSSLKDISKEIQSMKMMLKRLESSGVVNGVRRRRANLADLDLTIKEATSTEMPLSPPERPLLENVLDSMLLIDDSDDEETVEEKDSKNTSENRELT